MSHREELLKERTNLITRRKQLLRELDEVAPAYNRLRLGNSRSTEIHMELNQIRNKLIANSAYLEYAKS